MEFLYNPCMEFKFAFSSNAYTEYSLEEALHSIADCGYAGVEILADTPHLFTQELNVTQIETIRVWLQDLGLQVANVNANTARGFNMDPAGFEPSILHPDARLRNMRIACIQNAIRATRLLGGDCLAITSGMKPDNLSSDAATELLAHSLQPILSCAESEEVKVGIEYEPGFLLEEHQALLQLFEQVSHPLLGANLDIGHAVVAGEDPVKVIHALRGKIWNVHLEDIKNRVHDHLIPGLGEIDFNAVLQAFKDISYDRFLTLELYPYTDEPAQAAWAGLDYLSNL